MNKWDCVIVGSGPAGLGAAFELTAAKTGLRIIIIDKEKYSTGGLRNDCKMNFTFPIGFSLDYWNKEAADYYLSKVIDVLNPSVMDKCRLDVYQRRAEKLNVKLLNVLQSHLGTDGGLELIKKLTAELEKRGVEFALGETVTAVDYKKNVAATNLRELEYKNIIFAPGRKGFKFLQDVMNSIGVSYYDNVVDIGMRIETQEYLYPIVKDYYDPKFLFPDNVRTFCTNSKAAYVVQEKYTAVREPSSVFGTGENNSGGIDYYSVNGHAWSDKSKANNLVNFAVLKTIKLTHPIASGQKFAEILGLQASLCGGGKPIMQRVGDFRMGKRSSKNTFNDDLYDFKPTLGSCTPGDISLVMPFKLMKSIWHSLKLLDTITPGVLHPGTIMYYPEIKMYANKPEFINKYFMAKDRIYLIGDGAGTSRGITGAWASGIRAAEGIIKSLA